MTSTTMLLIGSAALLLTGGVSVLLWWRQGVAEAVVPVATAVPETPPVAREPRARRVTPPQAPDEAFAPPAGWLPPPPSFAAAVVAAAPPAPIAPVAPVRPIGSRLDGPTVVRPGRRLPLDLPREQATPLGEPTVIRVRREPEVVRAGAPALSASWR